MKDAAGTGWVGEVGGLGAAEEEVKNLGEISLGDAERGRSKGRRSPLAKGCVCHHFESEKLGNGDRTRNPKELSLASDGAFRIQDGGYASACLCQAEPWGPQPEDWTIGSVKGYLCLQSRCDIGAS